MADKWNSIFTGTIEDRPVEIEVYDDGGWYRVHTTQGADDPGKVEVDGSSTIIIPPTEKGRKITIEGDTPAKIRKDLLDEGFSEPGADAIVGNIPS